LAGLGIGNLLSDWQSCGCLASNPSLDLGNAFSIKVTSLRKAHYLFSQLFKTGLPFHIFNQDGLLDLFALLFENTLGRLLSLCANGKGLEYFLQSISISWSICFANISVCSCIAATLRNLSIHHILYLGE
jgi:hypothetical protein